MRVKVKINPSKFMDKRHAKEITKLSNFILIDIRVIFGVLSVYATVATIISTTAHNEATEDTINNRTFNLTDKPEHTNVPVKVVTSAVLWDCRQKSITHPYYKALYLILLLSFAIILLAFIGARLSVLCGWRYRLGQSLHSILWRLVLVKRMRQLIQRYGADDPRTKEKAKIYYKQWSKENDHTANWIIAVIPYCEAVFLVVALPFILTSYDLHPLGCLIGPDEDTIRYDNESAKVILDFTQGLLVYQKIALSSSVVFIIPIGVFAIVLLCKYKMVARSMGKEVDKVAGRIAESTVKVGQLANPADNFLDQYIPACVMGKVETVEENENVAMKDLNKKVMESDYELHDKDNEEVTTM